MPSGGFGCFHFAESKNSLRLETSFLARFCASNFDIDLLIYRKFRKADEKDTMNSLTSENEARSHLRDERNQACARQEYVPRKV
jgi:hypothetical protein